MNRQSGESWSCHRENRDWIDAFIKCRDAIFRCERCTVSFGVVISSVRLTSTSTLEDKNEIRLLSNGIRKPIFLFLYTQQKETQQSEEQIKHLNDVVVLWRVGDGVSWVAFLKKLKLLTCTIQFSAFSKNVEISLTRGCFFS